MTVTKAAPSSRPEYTHAECALPMPPGTPSPPGPPLPLPVISPANAELPKPTTADVHTSAPKSAFFIFAYLNVLWCGQRRHTPAISLLSRELAAVWRHAQRPYDFLTIGSTVVPVRPDAHAPPELILWSRRSSGPTRCPVLGWPPANACRYPQRTGRTRSATAWRAACPWPGRRA